jgi:hypothetical protein
MLGTEKGIWFTEDITATNPVWTQQIDGMANVPVVDLRQQIHPNGWMANNQLVFGGLQTAITNHGVIYAATRGRGIFRCESFRGPVSTPITFMDNTSPILVYPNPAQDFINLEFNLSVNSDVEINVLNLNGQSIISKKLNKQEKGKQTIFVPTSALSSGIYIVSVKSKDGMYLSRFIKQ